MDNKHFESFYPADTRYKQIEQLVSFIKEGNSAQLISLPGVGRSNVLRLLAYNRTVRIRHFGENQKYFHFVLLNFSEIRNKPLFEATKFMFLAIVESLHDRGWDVAYKRAYELFRESLNVNDELVLFQGLKGLIEFLANEKKLTTVLLFDRFEEYLPMITQPFFTNLRILRDLAKFHFSVLFSLNRPLDSLVEPTMLADFYEFVAGHTIFLPLFDKIGFDFRMRYLADSTGKTIDQKVLKTILELTAGHGKLTRVTLEVVSQDILQPTHPPRPTPLLKREGNSTPSPEGEGGGEGYILLSQKPVQGALYEIWYSLLAAEQKHLLLMPHPKEIIADPKGHTEMISFLENIYLIKDDSYTIPLFGQFVKEMLAHSPRLLEKITYDPQTNEIKKGGQTISDQLTSAEFRFLRFMTKNPERVCERDEIINAVWTDTKTAQGVSNEALDQMAYRLRKKIEEDPNIPKHLLTVKGRGFRFVA